MQNTEIQILPISEAAAKFQAEDINEFRKGMKRSDCIVVIGGIEMIDMTKLLQKADLKSQETGNGKRVKRTPSQVDFLNVSLELYGYLIAGKIDEIEAAKLNVADASNPYDKKQARRRLTSLQKDLERMERNYISNQNRLNAILNAGDEVESPAKAVEIPSTTDAPEGE